MIRAVGRFLRRWFRLLAPIALALAFTIGVLTVHALAQADVTDPNYLNPNSTSGIGGATLAARLTDAGVTVRRTTSIDEAFAWAREGDTTLFVPAPSLINGFGDQALMTMPSTTRVVLIEPTQATLSHAYMPADVVASWWTPHSAPAGCAAPEVAAAPVTGVEHTTYHAAAVGADCYHGSVVQLSPVDVWLIGSCDPFRNDRIGEYDNADFTTALLSHYRSVIWLDNHTAQPRMKQTRKVPNPFNHLGSTPQKNTDSPPAVRDSIAPLFPGWVWAVLGLAGLILLTFAIAASRRFGAPVAEPLPVTAKARETVEGRGRLYQKAKQPVATLNILRHVAMRALPAAFGVEESTAVSTLIDLVAQRTGTAREVVEAILVTDKPKRNDELVEAVALLDQLMASATATLVPTSRMDRP